MNIYIVLECYGETTRIVTENLNLALLDVVDNCDCNTQLEVWNNGVKVFESNQYEEGEDCYNNIYIELMSFLKEQESNNILKE